MHVLFRIVIWDLKCKLRAVWFSRVKWAENVMSVIGNPGESKEGEGGCGGLMWARDRLGAGVIVSGKGQYGYSYGGGSCVASGSVCRRVMTPQLTISCCARILITFLRMIDSWYQYDRWNSQVFSVTTIINIKSLKIYYYIHWTQLTSAT